MIRFYIFIVKTYNATVITSRQHHTYQQHKQQQSRNLLLLLSLFVLSFVDVQQQVYCFTIKIKQLSFVQSHYRYYSATTSRIPRATITITITRQSTCSTRIIPLRYTSTIFARRCKSYTSTFIPYKYNGRNQLPTTTTTGSSTGTSIGTMISNDNINVKQEEDITVRVQDSSNNDDIIVKDDYYFANTIVVERNVEATTTVEVQIPVTIATTPILLVNNQQQNDTNTNTENVQQNEQQQKSENKKKYHHYTICVVPPSIESNKYTWDTIQYTRKQLKDPGYYRWPPHINLLYPFHTPYTTSTIMNTTTSTTTTTISSQETTTNTAAIDFIANDTIIHDEQSTNDTNNNLKNNKKKKKSNNSILLETTEINLQIIQKLSNACIQCEPFICFLNNFGTFGNTNRGVLWLNPQTSTNTTATTSTATSTTSASTGSTNSAPTTTDIDTVVTSISQVSQLHKLQSLLEEQFPICTDLRVKGSNGIFTPHMTICHYQNLIDTNNAIQQLYNETVPLSLSLSKPSTSTVSVQASESTVAESSVAASVSASVGSEITNLQFIVNEIYLLQRNGDNGQFYRVADIRLGKNNVTTSPSAAGIGTTKTTSNNNNIAYYGIDNNETCSKASVVLYPNPIPFQYMPTIEDQWVNDERMKLKKRRNNNNSRRT